MAASSSTKKAAKLAQRGKGRSVRFQGGTLFPLIVAIVVVLGLGSVVYARQSVPSSDATQPTINDHWHAVYGFYICDEWYTLAGDLEGVDSQGRLASTPYLQTGVHSHDDGVIHWHAFTSRAVGRRATLGLFLDVYGVELNDKRLVFPAGQPGEGIESQEFIPGETTCDGTPAELSVVVWNDYTDTGSGTRYITNFENIRVQNDGMVFAVAFVPRGQAVPMPPWAQRLPELGAIDMGQQIPEELLGTGDQTTDGDAPASDEPTGDEPASDDTDG